MSKSTKTRNELKTLKDQAKDLVNRQSKSPLSKDEINALVNVSKEFIKALSGIIEKGLENESKEIVTYINNQTQLCNSLIEIVTEKNLLESDRVEAFKTLNSTIEKLSSFMEKREDHRHQLKLLGVLGTAGGCFLAVFAFISRLFGKSDNPLDGGFGPDDIDIKK